MIKPVFGCIRATAVTTASRYFGFEIGADASLNGSSGLMSQVIAVAGTVSNLTVNLQTAPGAGKSWTYTLYVNGNPTALTCTISDANTTGSDTTHSVTVAPGDISSWQQTPSGTPAATLFSLSGTFTGTNSGETNISAGRGTAPSTSVTNYSMISPGSSFSTNDAFISNVFPCDGVVDALYVDATGAPGAGNSYDITIMKNGSATTLTLNLADANLTGNATSAISFAAGDTISIRFTPNGTPGSLTNVRWAIRFKPTTDGEAPIFARDGSWLNSADFYGALVVGATHKTTEADAQAVAPIAFTMRKLYLISNAAPGAGKSWTITARKNGASQSLTAQLSGAATTANDTSNSVSCAAGDLMNWLVSPSGSPSGGAPGKISAAVFIAPPATGRSYGYIIT